MCPGAPHGVVLRPGMGQRHSRNRASISGRPDSHRYGPSIRSPASARSRSGCRKTRSHPAAARASTRTRRWLRPPSGVSVIPWPRNPQKLYPSHLTAGSRGSGASTGLAVAEATNLVRYRAQSLTGSYGFDPDLHDHLARVLTRHRTVTVPRWNPYRPPKTNLGRSCRQAVTERPGAGVDESLLPSRSPALPWTPPKGARHYECRPTATAPLTSRRGRRRQSGRRPAGHRREPLPVVSSRSQGPRRKEPAASVSA